MGFVVDEEYEPQELDVRCLEPVGGDAEECIIESNTAAELLDCLAPDDAERETMPNPPKHSCRTPGRVGARSAGRSRKVASQRAARRRTWRCAQQDFCWRRAARAGLPH